MDEYRTPASIVHDDEEDGDGVVVVGVEGSWSELLVLRRTSTVGSELKF